MGVVWTFLLSSIIYPFFPLSPSLWETARYRLKYCLKGPLNPKQPTNNSYFELLHTDIYINSSTIRSNVYLLRFPHVHIYCNKILGQTGWMDGRLAILRPFQQEVDNKRLCAMEEWEGKPSETDSIKFKISSKTPRGGKGQHKKTPS